MPVEVNGFNGSFPPIADASDELLNRCVTEAGYTLIDPRPIAAEAPYTFFLPSRSEIAAVDKNDLVKLTFEYEGDTEKWAAERMWVLVEKTDGDELRGVLKNHPDEPTSPLKEGDPVAFKREHILAIEWDNPDGAPPGLNRREFWDRCLVDQCVLDGEEPVEYLIAKNPTSRTKPTSMEIADGEFAVAWAKQWTRTWTRGSSPTWRLARSSTATTVGSGGSMRPSAPG